MSKKNNIISLIAFREKKQKLRQTKKKAYASISIETQEYTELNYQKQDKIVHMPEYRAKNRPLTKKSSNQQTLSTPSEPIDIEVYRKNKYKTPIPYWQSISKHAVNVAGLTAVMLFVINVFISQNHQSSTQQRGLASQTLSHSQILSSKDFVKKINKTFKNYPTSSLERDLDSISSPKKKPANLFFKGESS